MTPRGGPTGRTRCATRRTGGCPGSPGPCGMVIFGVTGDLSRKKLMPAIYDLANRGLLPPGFCLVGFARRDWADQDFAQIVHDSVKQHARTEFREEVWKQLAEGFRFVPGRLRRRRRLRPACAARSRSSTRSAAPAATTRSTCRSRRRSSATSSASSRSTGSPTPPASPGAGWSSRSRSATTWSPPASSTPSLDERLPAGVGLPDRPLPRQGDRPEHPGDAVRQHDVRADLERQLRRPRADHDGRGHRHRRPGRLLRRHRRRPRRHPEPPAPADGAGRDGGADVVRRREPADGEAEGARVASCCRGGSTSTTARGQYAAGWAGGEKVHGYLDEEGIPQDAPRPRPTPRSSSTSTPAAGPGCRSTCAPASGSAAGSPRSPSCSSGRRTCRSPRPRPRSSTQNALVIRVQPDEGMTMRFGSKVPGTAMEIRDVNMDFAYGGSLHRGQPGGLRAADPRRAARRPAAVPAARGGRAVLADPRPDPRALGRSKGKPEPYPSGTWGPASADEMLARDGRSLEAAMRRMIELTDTNSAAIAAEFVRGPHHGRQPGDGHGDDAGHRRRRGRRRGRDGRRPRGVARAPGAGARA